MDDTTKLVLSAPEFRLLYQAIDCYRDYMWFYPAGWPFEEQADEVDLVLKKLGSYDTGDMTVYIPVSRAEWKILLDVCEFIPGNYLLQPDSTINDFDEESVEYLKQTVWYCGYAGWRLDEKARS